jgi:hypothetical protein
MSTSSAPFDSRRTGFGACLYRGERPLGSNWRAGLLRSESGQYVESPERAEQVAACMEEGVRPEKSYRVLVDEDGDLVWVTETDGAEVRYDDEPQMILGQRFMSGSITVLPVEQ